MKRVDAWWDTRSLGVKCAELSLEKGDGLPELDEALEWAQPYEYVVVKVPSGDAAAVARVQEGGYAYIESSLGVTADLRNIEVPSFIARREKAFTCERATEETRERIFDQIRAGIFDTDRIALDPRFGKDVAARRYVNWINDELARGSSLYHVYYRDDEVAFFTMKEVVPEVECYPFLTGLYPAWRTSGLGANATVVAALREAQKLGYTRIRTRISSNNIAIVRVHDLLGFRIESIDHVFVRHLGESK